MKYIGLVTLTLQTAALIVSVHYTLVLSGDMYFTTTAVVILEFLKMVICLVIIYFQQESFSSYILHLHKAIIVNWKDTLKMSVPAIIYMPQIYLHTVAVSNLEAAVFQVTYQLKILTTAFFSMIMLNKKLSALKWSSLLVLFAGVALVQVQNISVSSKSGQTQNKFLGLFAVIVCCFSSSFAGVYFGKMLKDSDASVWLRSVQLGIFGSTTAVIGMLLTDGAAIVQKGFFFAYTPLVFVVVFQQAIGGLIVALVVRYADNILKGFATSLSIILSCIASVFLFDYHITLKFTIGASLVIVATCLYGVLHESSDKLPQPGGGDKLPSGAMKQVATS